MCQHFCATVTELAGAGAMPPADGGGQAAEFVPAVLVRKSLASKEHFLSLIDGKPNRALRGHFSGHGLTPQQYRERYNLKPDYPMVAESYSRQRRQMAKKIGVGAKGHAAKARDAAAPTPVRRRPRSLVSSSDASCLASRNRDAREEGGQMAPVRKDLVPTACRRFADLLPITPVARGRRWQPTSSTPGHRR
jgi:predicted transcriptional regulator